MRRLIGVPLAQSVHAGEAILRTDLSSLSDQQRTLSGQIPPGKRAISIFARPESSFAGLLRPGDRVDVLLTVGSREPDSGRAVVVAQNLLVLAVGLGLERTFDESRNRGRTDWTSQISLEVGLPDAQRLTLARGQGEMRLLLRNANDASVVSQPPEIHERELRDAARRGDWVRRFALVERAPPGVAPDAGL
jgi:pilus assembly protein CpaB